MTGEEPHGWNHAICLGCWRKRRPGQEPVRVRDDGTVKCCFCGYPTNAGIYVRERPNSKNLRCRRKG